MKKKVLIIDDEKEIVKFLQRGLLREGFDVICAYNGREAKEKILAEKPDVILLDLVMPGSVDGWEVLKWLRQEQKLSTPTIILSAKDAVIDMKKGYNLEVDTYLTKPVNISDVIGGIQLVCSLEEKNNKDNP